MPAKHRTKRPPANGQPDGLQRHRAENGASGAATPRAPGTHRGRSHQPPRDPRARRGRPRRLPPPLGGRKPSPTRGRHVRSGHRRRSRGRIPRLARRPHLPRRENVHRSITTSRGRQARRSSDQRVDRRRIATRRTGDHVELQERLASAAASATPARSQGGGRNRADAAAGLATRHDGASRGGSGPPSPS